MVVYRISKRSFAADLNGTGARLYGGRWNSVGIPMLYTASSRALAVLEMLVHVTHNCVPDDLEMVTIELPDQATREEIGADRIAEKINIYGIGSVFSEIGDEWIKSTASLILTVPSVIVPAEKNILINPLHAEHKKVKITDRQPFIFDSRLMVR